MTVFRLKCTFLDKSLLQGFFVWKLSATIDSATEILNTSEICVRTEVQYLGNAAWYRVGVNRWPIGNHPSFMLYRLADRFDTTWLKSQKLLWPRTVGLCAQAKSLLLCPALSYSALSWRGAPRKRQGTVKKFLPPTFKMLPAPLRTSGIRSQKAEHL